MVPKRTEEGAGLGWAGLRWSGHGGIGPEGKGVEGCRFWGAVAYSGVRGRKDREFCVQSTFTIITLLARLSPFWSQNETHFHFYGFCAKGNRTPLSCLVRGELGPSSAPWKV